MTQRLPASCVNLRSPYSSTPRPAEAAQAFVFHRSNNCLNRFKFMCNLYAPTAPQNLSCPHSPASERFRRLPWPLIQCVFGIWHLARTAQVLRRCRCVQIAHELETIQTIVGSVEDEGLRGLRRPWS